jgi:hypothetical protein
MKTSSFFALAISAVMMIGLTASTGRESRAGGSAPPPLDSPTSARTGSVRNPAVLAAQPQIAAAYGKLPLSFEANRGQTDPRVKFLSRGRGYGLLLTSTEAILTLRLATEADVSGPASVRNQAAGRLQRVLPKQDSAALTTTSLRMSLAGSNSAARVAGLDELPGKANYFLGDDPKKWRTGVPTYARVKYKNVYPGVDLFYYGNQQDLESDFVVAPGANPGAIRLKFRGAKSIEINRNGDLVLKIHGGETILHKPVTYQSNGKDASPASDAGKHFVAARYVLRGQREVQFGVEDYDRSRTLVIDPVLSYSTFLGGSRIDGGRGIAVDASGNAYVTGFTQSTDFPTVNSFQNNSGGGLDAFVTKLDPTGTSLLYSTYLGGSGDDIGLGIAVDGAGSAYITGYTPSSNFPTLNPFQKTCSACIVTAFVTKLDPSGSKLEYSTYLGGGIGDIGTAIVVDGTGSAYVTGRTISNNFPTTPSAYDTTCGTDGNCNASSGSLFFDGFITKLSADGKTLVFSTYLGGSFDDYPLSIAVDSSSNAYVTGFTFSTDFPTTPGSFQQTCSCDLGEGFVTKLNPTGSALAYSTFLGGTKGTMGALLASVAVDGSGSAYVTGQTGATDYPTTPGALQTTNNGGVEAVVTKLNSAGSALTYSTYLGGSQDDSGLAIAVDSTGAAYVLGETESPNFLTVAPLQAACAGLVCSDFFVAKLAASGSSLIYSTFLGGSGEGNNISLIGVGFNFASLAIDNNGNAYLTSGTGSPDFPIIVGAPYPDCVGCPGVGHAFIAKISDADAAAITIFPRSLVFDRQGLGVTTQPLTVAVGDRGSGPLTITNIATSGDFASTNTCGSGLADGRDCAVAVTFMPTAAGTRTGELTFADSVTGSVNTIPLSGTGVDGPVGRLSPGLLSFVAGIGSTSSPQTVTLTNVGNTALTISGIGTTGDFAETNTCPSTLASTATCAISVTFAPTHNGKRTGLLTVADNDVLSPQTAALTGFGTGALLNVTPGGLTFGEQGQGTSSTQTVFLADVDNKFGQSISSITVTGNPDFAQTNNCPASLTALGFGGSSCTISVTFKPSALAAETATLTIVAGLTYTVPLSGTGVDFSISASPSALSVAAGGTATSTLSLVPQGGFNLATNLSCSVSPFASGLACSVAPTSVTPDGSTAATATVTVTTAARTSSSAGIIDRSVLPDSRLWAALFCLSALACVFIPTPRRRSGSRQRTWIGIGVVLFFALLSFGCGGGSSASSAQSGTPAGTYTLTVTGTSGTLAHTINLTLKVN